ncbi:hypothetical protein NEOLEDRAFT_884072 [Neolentinus lepideus HHB14362 ss-1]|uniref:Uncharacterized protein n=1 Tax=Neolentinus lepideus HHB14362 ss-1 TaxID=1314782 RepID=A0A165NYG2_9AGAM|nr:hypothetical protein NEOLEDRAFT_884072 [Neolentinus lepideus HHB14362 ss-1]
MMPELQLPLHILPSVKTRYSYIIVDEAPPLIDQSLNQAVVLIFLVRSLAHEQAPNAPLTSTLRSHSCSVLRHPGTPDQDRPLKPPSRRISSAPYVGSMQSCFPILPEATVPAMASSSIG